MYKSTKSKPKAGQIDHTDNTFGKEQRDPKNKKKIVSYSLDVELLHQIRKVAQKQDRYYSSIVSEALQSFLHKQNKRADTR